MEVEANDKNFKKEVLESKIPVLVDFWAEWCGPCQMIAPTINTVAKEYKGKLKVCKLNVDEAPQIASEYNIMSIPTLVIFNKGEEAGKIIGVVSKPELKEALKLHI